MIRLITVITYEHFSWAPFPRYQKISFIYNRHVKTTSTRNQYAERKRLFPEPHKTDTSENRLISLAPDVVVFQRFHYTTQYIMTFSPTDEFCLCDM